MPKPNPPPQFILVHPLSVVQLRRRVAHPLTRRHMSPLLLYPLKFLPRRCLEVSLGADNSDFPAEGPRRRTNLLLIGRLLGTSSVASAPSELPQHSSRPQDQVCHHILNVITTWSNELGAHMPPDVDGVRPLSGGSV